MPIIYVKTDVLYVADFMRAFIHFLNTKVQVAPALFSRAVNHPGVFATDFTRGALVLARDARSEAST